VKKAATYSIIMPFLFWLDYAELVEQMRLLYFNDQYHNSEGTPNPNTTKNPKLSHPKI